MTDLNPDELRIKALLLAELAKRVAGEIAETKKQLRAVMVPGQTNRPSIDIDGHKTQAGTVVYTDPETKAPSWVISDPVAFLAWVDQLHPTEVEVIEQARPAFLKTLAIVGDLVVDSDAAAADGVTVIHPEPSAGHITVSPSKDPAINDAVWRLIRSAPAALLGGADDE